MALHEAVAAYFVQQAQACERLGSPFMARLCGLLAGIVDESTQTGRRILEWPGDPRADAVALRLCGGLHRLVLTGADPALKAVYPPNEPTDAALAGALRGALARNGAALGAALDSAPQTNEIARSAMLLPGFLAIANETGLPLALCEIGSSAGLNLLFDRFFYRYGNTAWGDPAAPVRLAPEIRGPVPPLSGSIAIRARAGCDIAPIDVGVEEDRLRLRSYVWPDQPARLERLDGAIALAGRVPFSLERADAARFVRSRLAERPKDAAFVLFHSVMWQYLPRATKDDILAALSEAGANATAEAPVARLRMEPLGPEQGWTTLSLTTWPGGETRRLARCDYHGRWIEWFPGA